MRVNCYNLFFISAVPKQTESMCSFTPHFTQGDLTLDSDANGGLEQVKVLMGPFFRFCYWRTFFRRVLSLLYNFANYFCSMSNTWQKGTLLMDEVFFFCWNNDSVMVTESLKEIPKNQTRTESICFKLQTLIVLLNRSWWDRIRRW